jgi:hypothetical protein
VVGRVLYLVGGAPRVGKSTLAQLLLLSRDGVGAGVTPQELHSP